MKFKTKMLGLVLTGLFCAGCAAPTFRAHPQLNEKMRTAKTVLVMPPEIKVYQLSAGGVKEEIDKWSEEAQKNVMTAIYDLMRNKTNIIFQPFPEDSLSADIESSLKETQALFDAVNLSIIIHTYGPKEQSFPDKIENFDYSIGPDAKKLAEQADALFFVRGTDHVSTAGRVALQWTKAILLTAITGVGTSPDLGSTQLTVSLVDADTGNILWHNFKGSSGNHDLRDISSTSELVSNLLKNFPAL